MAEIFLVPKEKLAKIVDPGQTLQLLQVQYAESLPPSIILLKATPKPINGMIHNSGTDHIQIDAENAIPGLCSAVHQCGTVTLAPESVPPAIPAVVVSGNSSLELTHTNIDATPDAGKVFRPAHGGTSVVLL